MGAVNAECSWHILWLSCSYNCNIVLIHAWCNFTSLYTMKLCSWCYLNAKQHTTLFTNLLFRRSSHQQNVVRLLTWLQCQQLQLIIDRECESLLRSFWISSSDSLRQHTLCDYTRFFLLCEATRVSWTLSSLISPYFHSNYIIAAGAFIWKFGHPKQSKRHVALKFRC